MDRESDPSGSIFDPETYLKNKNNGGKSGRTGYQYEMRFGATELIRLARRVRDKRLDPVATWLWAQLLNYVDDFVISEPHAFRCFEMKSGANADWGDQKEPKTTAWNFAQQMLADNVLRCRREYTLVLGHPDRIRLMRGGGPKGVNVIGFPVTNSMLDLAENDDSLIETIAELLDGDGRDYILTVLKVEGHLYFGFDSDDAFRAYHNFCSAFDRIEAATPYTLDEVLWDVNLLSSGCVPYVARDIGLRLKAALTHINGVEFVTCNGILFFKTGFGEIGQLPVPIASVAFRGFENAVLKGEVLTLHDIHIWMAKLEKAREIDELRIRRS